jgi:F-type H+-transporting ATPase subunit epsilon
MNNKLYAEIITPESVLYSGEVKVVGLPGEFGTFEVMNNHAPIISTLVKGKIKIKDTNGSVTEVEIITGVVEVVNNEVKILVSI